MFDRRCIVRCDLTLKATFSKVQDAQGISHLALSVWSDATVARKQASRRSRGTCCSSLALSLSASHLCHRNTLREPLALTTLSLSTIWRCLLLAPTADRPMNEQDGSRIWVRCSRHGHKTRHTRDSNDKAKHFKASCERILYEEHLQRYSDMFAAEHVRSTPWQTASIGGIDDQYAATQGCKLGRQAYSG